MDAFWLFIFLRLKTADGISYFLRFEKLSVAIPERGGSTENGEIHRKQKTKSLRARHAGGTPSLPASTLPITTAKAHR
jgi:hypothetical protein